jgi:glycerol-3-phosphate acyltransferase PlsX
MASSMLLLRPVEGVDRPSVATVLPTAGKSLVMLDAGANVDCKPRQLLQFGRLGAIYAQDVLGRERPRVGLLNIGEEPEKGDERTVAAHELLRGSELNFVGNIEGRDVITGSCDVLVTDGFAGNVLLKFYEAVAAFVGGLIRERFPDADPDAVSDVTRILDYTEAGGAPLLGVNGVSIICHGGSPPRAIRSAIGVAIQSVESDVVGHIRREIALRATPAVTVTEDT